MSHRRRTFGPLFLGTVASALAILVSVPVWNVAQDHWRAWQCSRQLGDPLRAVSAEAAAELVRIGPAAVGWVIRAMHDPDPLVRRHACSIVGRTDSDQPARIVAALINALRDRDPAVRHAAVDQLGVGGGYLVTAAGPATTGRAVAALGGTLGDADGSVRIGAAVALEALGPTAQAAVPALDVTLAGADPDLRVFAAQALLRIDPVGSRPRVLAAITAMLADPTVAWERWRLVRLLTIELGQDGAAGVLIPLLRHADRQIRQAALHDLVEHCPGAVATRAALNDALAAEDGYLRCEAAFFLLEHGDPLASRPLATLVEQLVCPRDDGMVIETIIQRLRAGSPGALGRVVAGLIEPPLPADEPVRLGLTLDALRVIGSAEAKPAVPLLQELAASPRRELALRAIEALAAIEPAAAGPCLPVLVELARPGPEIAVRLTALATLGQLGPVAGTAIPALLPLADEEEIRVSAAALAALARIDPARGDAWKLSIRDRR